MQGGHLRKFFKLLKCLNDRINPNPLDMVLKNNISTRRRSVIYFQHATLSCVVILSVSISIDLRGIRDGRCSDRSAQTHLEDNEFQSIASANLLVTVSRNDRFPAQWNLRHIFQKHAEKPLNWLTSLQSDRLLAMPVPAVDLDLLYCLDCNVDTVLVIMSAEGRTHALQSLSFSATLHGVNKFITLHYIIFIM